MAVDANVLVFERIREELRHGGWSRRDPGGIRSGVQHDHRQPLHHADRGVLPVRVRNGCRQGFAVTLNVGIVANLFTA